MKRYIYKCTAVLFILGLLSSCNDLEQINPNYTDSATFWKDLNDTNSGLTAAYTTLLSQYVFNLREEMVRSDMGYFSNSRPTPVATNDLAYTFWYQNYGSNNQFIDRHWAACYRGIFRCNQVIEALERIKPTSDATKWTYQMAQARFLRGLFHFYLHTSFNNGKVIIEDHTPITKDDFYKKVSTSQQVMDFFRDDLQYAYDNLPAERPAEKGRATKAAAATVLGTSYLYANEHAKAEPYFDNVINNTAYSLFGTVASGKDPITMYYTANEFNSESIFEVNFDGAFRPELGNFDEESTTTRLSFLSFSQQLCFNAPAWVAYAYKTEPMDALDARNHIGGVLANPLRGVPLRASAMVTLPEDLETPTYGVPAVIDVTTAGLTLSAVNASASPRVFAYYKKYLNVDIYNGESANPLGAQKSSKNFIVHRLSEVYLMQAECMIKKGNKDEALKLINRVRARWGLKLYGVTGEFAGTRTYDGIIYSNTDVMNKIMFVDKALETAAEGHATRFADLRRWGILKSNFVALASKTFYTEDFVYKKTVAPNLGTNVTKFKASVVNEANKTVKSLPIDNEFTIPAQNFTEGLSEYLPLPSNEVGRNFNLSN